MGPAFASLRSIGMTDQRPGVFGSSSGRPFYRPNVLRRMRSELA